MKMLSNAITDDLNKEITPSVYIGCEECDGTGFVPIIKDGYEFKERCKCYRTFQSLKLKEKSNIPELYVNSDFTLDESVQFYRFNPLGYKPIKVMIDGVEKQRKVLQFKKPEKYDINEFGKQYSQVTIGHLNKSPRLKSVSLILSGAVGSGKTSLACAIANDILEKGYNVCYIKTKQYLDNVIRDSYTRDEKKSQILKDKRDYLNGFKPYFKDNCHLLVLDELGYEYQKTDSAFALSEIKDLLRNRAEKSLPTVITTNFLFDDLAKTYEEELMSMFAQSYMFFFVVCKDDYRIKKSEELNDGFDLDNLKI